MATLGKALVWLTLGELALWLVLFFVWHFGRGFVPAFFGSMLNEIRHHDKRTNQDGPSDARHPD